MKKLFFVFAAFSILATACNSQTFTSIGTNEVSPPQTASEATKAPEATAPSSPEPSQKAQEQPKDDHPEGHLYLKGYEKLYINVDRARYVKDAFDRVYLAFDLTVKNGTDKSIKISDLSFALITKNKEVLEWEPGSPVKTRSATLASGGTAKASVAFRANFEEVEELVFADGEPVYRITAFPEVENFQSTEKQKPTEEVPPGGGVKADNYEN